MVHTWVYLRVARVVHTWVYLRVCNRHASLSPCVYQACLPLTVCTTRRSVLPVTVCTTRRSVLPVPCVQRCAVCSSLHVYNDAQCAPLSCVHNDAQCAPCSLCAQRCAGCCPPSTRFTVGLGLNLPENGQETRHREHVCTRRLLSCTPGCPERRRD